MGRRYPQEAYAAAGAAPANPYATAAQPTPQPQANNPAANNHFGQFAPAASTAGTASGPVASANGSTSPAATSAAPTSTGGGFASNATTNASPNTFASAPVSNFAPSPAAGAASTPPSAFVPHSTTPSAFSARRRDDGDPPVRGWEGPLHFVHLLFGWACHEARHGAGLTRWHGLWCRT